MRLKARACGIDAEDYHTDQLLDDISLLARGYHEIEGSFWERVAKVETRQLTGQTVHEVQLTDNLPALHLNDFIIDDQGFIGWVKGIEGGKLTIRDLHQEPMLHQECWGLRPRHLPGTGDVRPDGPGHPPGQPHRRRRLRQDHSGIGRRHRADHGHQNLPPHHRHPQHPGAGRGHRLFARTEKEKMEPWLGAITDNLEALHMDDESTHGSVEYILDRVPLQFKSLNYIRGRSFQQSFILIDESQNLTPHQIKTIITRAGNGSR